MFEYIIKRKRKRYYLFISLFFGLILLLSIFSKVSSLEDFKSIDFLDKKSKLSSEIEVLEEKRDNVNNQISKLSKNLVDDKKLKIEIDKVCSKMINSKVFNSCRVSSIINPYGYINIVKIDILADDEFSKVVIKRVFSKLYNIKKIDLNMKGVSFEIINR